MNRAFAPAYMDQITCWELAREEIRRMQPSGQNQADPNQEQAENQVTTILLMAIMLTAGKLALLPARERRKQKQYIQLCHDKIKEETAVPGAFEALSKGYRVKIRIFQAVPELYLLLYHLRGMF